MNLVEITVTSLLVSGAVAGTFSTASHQMDKVKLQDARTECMIKNMEQYAAKPNINLTVDNCEIN